MLSGNYVLDALYGPIRFPDYAWEVISCPEIQRPREERLYNIYIHRNAMVVEGVMTQHSRKK